MFYRLEKLSDEAVQARIAEQFPNDKLSDKARTLRFYADWGQEQDDSMEAEDVVGVDVEEEVLVAHAYGLYSSEMMIRVDANGDAWITDEVVEDYFE